MLQNYCKSYSKSTFIDFLISILSLSDQQKTIMDSQTSADDFINNFDRSCSCSNLSDTTFGVSNGCCAKDMVDKLMVQLKEKDEQLEEKDKTLEANKEDIKVFEFPFMLTKNGLIATRQKILPNFLKNLKFTSQI
jgi:hypothetical protein